ncbi:MAG: tetratricopeptide repeat protein [Hyphomonadaceae bacterium]|jgi:tetratricopeptide (TPR) repeat protein|nr:tetratricopeptide repeat protein [Hyphomonadaceae bacterium]
MALAVVWCNPALSRQAAPAIDWQARDSARLQTCLAMTETDAEAAYEEGLAWRFSGGGQPAGHCLAAALVARGSLEDGAAMLLALANAPDGGPDPQRALLLSKAANAWMLAGDPDAALAAINRALELAPGTRDLLTDQAVALALLKRWPEAQNVLDGLIAENGRDAVLFRLRAETGLQLGQYDAADRDVEAAIRLAPSEIDNYVVRGRAREARRLRRPPD